MCGLETRRGDAHDGEQEHACRRASRCRQAWRSAAVWPAALPTVRYTGTQHNIPRYACCRVWLDQGEPRCIAFGGLRADDGIEAALLEVVGPGAVWGGYEVVDT